MDAVEILKGLKDKGVRFTPQRQAILEFLLATDIHPTAEDIYKQVKVKFPGVSLGTIYNTLNMLKEHGFILELTCGDMSSRFDGNPVNHYHAMCNRCGKVVDFPCDLVEMDKYVAEKTNFIINTHNLVFYGICPECQKEQQH
ncbi:MAG: peptide ABC transporter substrate-binding protein [Gracilibacter sp. BRH_c7a]|nr:MAG: peptide ABC transporter substrate-binding protein [Gracilibacter sp. BRH_c7a]